MHLFYYKDKIGNFGDDLNPWMWPQIFGKSIEDVLDPSHIMIGIGTILSDANLSKIKPPPEKWVVMGSGAGYGHTAGVAPMLRRCPRIFVRGPHSAAVLGLPREKAIVDSAVLISRLPPLPMPQGPRHKVSVLLHHVHHKLCGVPWVRLCSQLGWNYLDVSRKPQEIIPQLLRSDLVITESMHGAVCADALGVPWIPFATSPSINLFKWVDWSASISLPMEMNWITALTLQREGNRIKVGHIKEVAQQLRRLNDHAPRYLGSRQTLNSLTERVLEFTDRLLK